MTQAVNALDYSERLEKTLNALEKMRSAWKSGVPVRRWNYTRITKRALCRAGHW